MHIRIDYRNGGKHHITYFSEYHKGKARNPKCHFPQIMDADLFMQTVADVLKKIAEYSISNRAGKRRRRGQFVRVTGIASAFIKLKCQKLLTLLL